MTITKGIIYVSAVFFATIFLLIGAITGDILIMELAAAIWLIFAILVKLKD